jgi:hypothetical protein
LVYQLLAMAFIGHVTMKKEFTPWGTGNSVLEEGAVFTVRNFQNNHPPGPRRVWGYIFHPCQVP